MLDIAELKTSENNQIVDFVIYALCELHLRKKFGLLEDAIAELTLIEDGQQIIKEILYEQ